jgi:hypothetical protein
MPNNKMMRVSTGPLERARELLPTLPKMRFGEGEPPAMSDRQLVDAGLGWLAGRLSGDAFTRAEVDATVLRTITDVLGQTLGVKVNGMALDGKLTLTWESPDKERNEVVVNLTA